MLSTRDRLLEFVAKYGERGYLLLKAIIEVADEYKASPRGRLGLGDFDFRGIKRWLAAAGLDYNPTLLLRALERDYGVIETSYRSSNQRWWRIIDRESIVEAVARYEGKRLDAEVSDPELQLVLIQASSLGLQRIKEMLQGLLAKEVLSEYDRELFKRLAFGDLEYVVRVAGKMARYPEEFKRELKLIEEILEMATLLSKRFAEGRDAARGTALVRDALAGQRVP